MNKLPTHPEPTEATSDCLLKNASIIKGISSSLVRAKAAERDGNCKGELRYLLFAAQETLCLLTKWYNDKLDDEVARPYAESLCHTATRVSELIAAGQVKVICNINNFACQQYGCRHSRPHKPRETCKKELCPFSGIVVECLPYTPEDIIGD